LTRDEGLRLPDAQAAKGRGRSSLRGRLWAWIDERTGADRILRGTLDEPIPGGARFAYVFGSALLFIFVSQIVTGICLALYYVPAPMVAHVSVAYIVKEVAAGSFLRSLHAYGSSAMVVVLLLHLLQTLLYGSYKGKREFLWMSGCALLLLVLGMAFTGYLLPWDQKAYFAGSVGTDIVGQVPLIGESLRRLLRGGATMGALTISRFYVLHVLIIPGLIFALIATHVALFRKAGAAGPANLDPVTPRAPAETFYPKQVLVDMAFVLIVMGVLGMLAHFLPVTLGPEANPTDTQYLPRPEWYFLPMFQWLKYWEGSHTVIGIVLIPAILIALLFLLPFMDRGLERRPWRRPIPVGGVFIVLGGLLWLGMTSHLEDSRDPAVAAQLAQQSEQERAYSQAAFQPYSALSPSGAAGTPPLDAPVRAKTAEGTAAPSRSTVAANGPAKAMPGEAIYQAQGCAACHGVGGTGTSKGPDLTQLSQAMTPAALTNVLQHPTDRMHAGGMPPVQATGTDLSALVEYLQSLATPTAVPTLATTAAKGTAAPSRSTVAASSPAKAMPGEAIYQAQGCATCHGLGGTGTSKGPDLTQLSQAMTSAALTNVLQHPTDRMHAGGMPPVQATGTDLSALVAYLQSLATPIAAPTLATTAATGAPSSSAAPVASHQVEQVASQRAMNDDETKGKVIFDAHGCAKCHGTGGVAGTAAAPGLTGAVRTAPALLTTMLRHPTARMQQGGMPPVSVSDAELQSLVAYVSYISLSKRDP
jgi:ubiquinol-cytochrome c reductase cytochrome b subunit